MKQRGLFVARALVIALAIAASATVWVGTAPETDAALGFWAYYSNATYTTVVGARGTGCCGQPINWGITTPYKRFQRIYCTDQVCPN
jgi:hypothetical protein